MVINQVKKINKGSSFHSDQAPIDNKSMYMIPESTFAKEATNIKKGETL